MSQVPCCLGQWWKKKKRKTQKTSTIAPNSESVTQFMYIRLNHVLFQQFTHNVSPSIIYCSSCHTRHIIGHVSEQGGAPHYGVLLHGSSLIIILKEETSSVAFNTHFSWVYRPSEALSGWPTATSQGWDYNESSALIPCFFSTPVVSEQERILQGKPVMQLWRGILTVRNTE